MDTLLRAINEPETIRVIAATTTESVREACRRQGATHVSAIAIGRALTSGALLATLAKTERERVRVQLSGSGPVGQVVIDAHGDGRVRACLRQVLPAKHLANRMLDEVPRPSTSVAVGLRGTLTVTRDLGLATPYQGSVELDNGEIDDDLQHYLITSEQLPSALRTAIVLDSEGQVLRAAGVLAQSFPGSDPADIDAVRTRLVDLRAELVGHARTPAELIGLALDGHPARHMAERNVEFHCPCGPQRALSVLATLGPTDLEALAKEREQTEVTCNFCGLVTPVAAAEIEALAKHLRETQN